MEEQDFCSVVLVEAFWDFHVDFFVKIAVKVSHLNVDVVDFPVLFSCEGAEEADGLQSGDQSVCVHIIQSMDLGEAVGNKVSLVSFHVTL